MAGNNDELLAVFTDAVAGAIARNPSLGRALATAIADNPELLAKAVAVLDAETLARAIAEKVMLMTTRSITRYAEGIDIYKSLSRRAQQRAIEIVGERIADEMAADVRTA
jgi:hypothetical protein